MKISLSIDCDNAAFEGMPELEIQRILRRLADRLNSDTVDDVDGLPLMDANGNRVGVVSVDA